MNKNSQPDPIKKFGQHYLINTGVVEKISERVRVQASLSNQSVVEIGPGPGALTKALLKKGLQVLAIEVDGRMVEHLKMSFSPELSSKQLTVLHQDVLSASFDLEQFKDYAVACGNLPYNIGTDIVFKFLTESTSFKWFTFMLQKEMVDRLASEHGSRVYGAASVRFQWLAQVEDRFNVRPGSFQPPPKVDSAVICYSRRIHVEEWILSSKAFQLLDQIFQKRRKMLRGIFPELKDTPVAQMRPEQLNPDDFKKLLTGYLLARL